MSIPDGQIKFEDALGELVALHLGGGTPVEEMLEKLDHWVLLLEGRLAGQDARRELDKKPGVV